MKCSQFFKELDFPKQNEYKKYLINSRRHKADEFEVWRKQLEKWQPEDWEKVLAEWEVLLKDIEGYANG